MYASMFWVTLDGDSTSFGVGKTLDLMILTWSMLFKVKVPKEWMRPATNDAHNEMNNTIGVGIGQSRGELDLTNDGKLFLVIATTTRWMS